MVFCTYCGQSFTKDEHLERHILTHTNVKPFKCFTCHMSFARRDLLQRHYTVHGRDQNNQEGLPPSNGIIPISAGRTPIACSNCAKTKTKCDKKFPCSRCAGRNLKCTLRPTRRVSKQMNRVGGLVQPGDVGVVGAASSDPAESSSQSTLSKETASSENGPYASVGAHEGQILSSAPSLISSSGTESSYPSTEGFNIPPFIDSTCCDVFEERDVVGAGGWAETGDSENVHTWFLKEPMYPEPYETAGKHETKFSTPSAPPDPKIPRESHQKRLKDYLINKLMRKANELLGYTSSEASQSCVSSDESSDTLSDGRPDSIHETFQDVRHGEPTYHHSPSDSPDGGKMNSQGGTLTSSASGAESSFSNIGSKRKNDSRDEGEENEDRGKRNKRMKGSQFSGDPKRTRRFACPFYKGNPELHASCTSCVWPGFETIARTKEHIYRKHVNHVCPRCHESFDSNDVLLNHLAQTERCSPAYEPLQQSGIDESQVQKLRLRLRGRVDEEKWRNIYRICHRLAEDAPTPSPYCDQDSLALQAVEGYDQFQRIHLPSRIRERLEAEADSNPEFVQLYEGLLSRLPDMIREVQMAVYETYANLQRATAYPNQPRDQRNSPTNANITTLAALPQTELPAPNTWRGNVAGPPVAFGPPPNTEDGMTLDEARQIHTLSGEQGDKNSDSGYSTNPQANASSDGLHPEISLQDSSHPEGDHSLGTMEENPGMNQFEEGDPLSGFNFDPDSTGFDFDPSLFVIPDVLPDFNPEFGG